MQHFDTYLINPKVFTEALVLSRRLQQLMYCLTVTIYGLTLLFYITQNLFWKKWVAVYQW